MNKARPKLTYANVMSTIAVVVAVGGGTAFAATKLITGKEIKNSSITGVDIKDGTLGAAELSPAAKSILKGSAGPQGPQGLQGPAGAAGVIGTTGPKGDPGRSALSTLLPGEKLTGGFNVDAHATAGGQDFRQWAAFPISTATTPLVTAAVDDAACTGTAAAPTAPAGKVCVYTYVANNATLQVFPSPQAAGTRGFVVGVASLAAGDTFAIGSWAYTAP
jgi:hypothetical protein